MWRDTRLVVLTSVIAAIHAAALIPFKPIVILPGVTEVRPGMVLPIVFSILFGPAAAWGTAIGNTMGDMFGSLGPGTLFGFLGNLLYGFIPYRVWEVWRGGAPDFRRVTGWAVYLLAALASSAACALAIGWGIHLLRLFPFVTTAGIILVNNLLVGLLLGPPLLVALYPRVARMNLLYRDLSDESLTSHTEGRKRMTRVISRGAGLAVAAAGISGIAAGYLAAASGGTDTAITAAAGPFLLAVLLASLLL